MDKPCDWDFIWINVCDTIAKRSRDPSTKCGAVLVSPDYRRVHLGYNNFPPEIKDTYERWNNRKLNIAL